MSIVNGQDNLTDHEKRACSGIGFQHTCHIYSCRDHLEVFSVCVEQILQLFC